MVFGLVMLTTAVPTIIGLNEATKGTRDYEEERRSSARKQRCHLLATCAIDAAPESLRSQIHNASVFVRDGQLFLTKDPSTAHKPYSGSFYAHPSFPPGNSSALVAVSDEDPPKLRWIFCDQSDFKMRLGGKDDSRDQCVGPFDWSPDEGRLTLQGWEGWLAVKTAESRAREAETGCKEWQLYFDLNDDGASLPRDAQAVEINILRTMATS